MERRTFLQILSSVFFISDQAATLPNHVVQKIVSSTKQAAPKAAQKPVYPVYKVFLGNWDISSLVQSIVGPSVTVELLMDADEC